MKFSKDVENENDAVVKQYIAMSIGNLAAEPENPKEILRFGTSEPLVQLLNGPFRSELCFWASTTNDCR